MSSTEKNLNEYMPIVYSVAIGLVSLGAFAVCCCRGGQKKQEEIKEKDISEENQKE